MMSSLKRIAALDFYTEGPAMDASGNIYFTTLAGRAVMKVDAAGNMTAWAQSELPNGQIILPNGDHLICDSSLGKILRFSSTGVCLREETSHTCAAQKVHVPNDLAIDGDGNLYFTDSIRTSGSVFFVGADGTEAVIASGLDYPNGLAISNDGATLFVAESYRNRIIAIDLKKKSGRNYEVFIDLPDHPSGDPANNLPDGIAINRQGSMAVAHYGMQCVQILSPEGKLIASYDTTMPCTSNVFFADEKTLIVTGGYGEPGPGAVFSLTIQNK
jgi:gluconolactonase